MLFKSYNKYRNKPTIISGIRFASKREARRYQDLILLERSKVIRDLKLQPIFKFPMGFSYRADFSYFDDKGKFIVEDVKGIETEIFKLKKKCLEYFYPAIKLNIIK